MGKISDSFKRQIGRDAGKVVSNIIWGDKHSSPYRRVAAKNDANKVVATKRAEMEEKKLQMHERQAQAHLKIQENQANTKVLLEIDGAVIKAVDAVIATPVPSDIPGIVKLINDFEIQLEANKWLDSSVKDENQKQEAKIRNKYPDAVLKKYEQCVQELRYAGDNQERINDLVQKVKKYKKSKVLGTNKKRIQRTIFRFFIAIVIIFLLLVITKPF